MTERLRRDSVGRSLSSNLVFTIWAVFGGFILHFLLCNYLTVLLRTDFEEPVETAEDIIDRGIIPFYIPYGQSMKQFFEDSSVPIYQNISRKIVIPKNDYEFWDLIGSVNSTGRFAWIGNSPWSWAMPEERYWYRSSETIGGFNPYVVHLSNKKWPLKKVLPFS